MLSLSGKAKLHNLIKTAHTSYKFCGLEQMCNADHKRKNSYNGRKTDR